VAGADAARAGAGPSQRGPADDGRPVGTQGQTDRGEVTGRGSGGHRGSPDDGKKGKSGVPVK